MSISNNSVVNIPFDKSWIYIHHVITTFYYFLFGKLPQKFSYGFCIGHLCVLEIYAPFSPKYFCWPLCTLRTKLVEMFIMTSFQPVLPAWYQSNRDLDCLRLFSLSLSLSSRQCCLITQKESSSDLSLILCDKTKWLTDICSTSQLEKSWVEFIRHQTH